MKGVSLNGQKLSRRVTGAGTTGSAGPGRGGRIAAMVRYHALYMAGVAVLVCFGTGVWALLAYCRVLHPVTVTGLAAAAVVGVPLTLLGGWWNYRTNQHRTRAHRRPARRIDSGRVDTESH